MASHTMIDYIGAWATFGTALGTIGLAIATFVLALKTRALAKSGRETADAAQLTAKAAERELQLLGAQTDEFKRQSSTAEAALNASAKPLLIDVPYHTTRTIQVQKRPGETEAADVDLSVISASVLAPVEGVPIGRLTVPVRNIGAGVALGLAAAVTVARKDAVGPPIARGEAPSIIAAGEPAWIRFEDTPGPASAAEHTPLMRLVEGDEDLVVEVAYSDVAGRQEAATSLYLTLSGRTDRSYRVTQVVPGHAPRLTAGR